MPFLRKDRQSGVTLLEVIVVAIMIAVLTALAAPSFFGYIQRQNITNGISELELAIAAARNEAREAQTISQATFRIEDGELQYAVHQAGDDSDSECDSGVTAYTTAIDLEGNGLELDTENTDFVRDEFYSDEVNCSPTLFRIQFNATGGFDDVDPDPYFTRLDQSDDEQLAKIVLVQGDARRCITVATLIGGTAKFEDDDCLFVP